MYRNVDTAISFLVKSLPRLYNDFYLEYIKLYIQDVNVNKTQMRAMTFIKNYGSISMSELCNMLNIEKGSLTSMIDDLERKKYVERLKDEKDRRKYNIVLTENGEVLARNFLEYLETSLGSKIEKIGKSEMTEFFNSMKVIIETLDAMDRQ